MWFLSLYASLLCLTVNGYLYPKESESRQVKSLNGLWLFNYGDRGFLEKWYEKKLKFTSDYSFMPVPSSFNEIRQDPSLRDFIGWVWYQKEFYLGKKWSGSRIFLYFGAVDHHATVWCNGIEVGKHTGGHVPFHIEITNSVSWDGQNLLTVAVNNTLTPYSLPQGYTTYPNDTSKYPPGTSLYSHNCDYFDYAGINRNVFLYSVPRIFIKDLDVTASYDGLDSLLEYKVKLSSDVVGTCSVVLINLDSGSIDYLGLGCEKSVKIGVYNWKPGLSHLYTLEVTMKFEKYIDIYRSDVGFRSIDWSKPDGIKISGSKIYLKGFGMHEDSDIRGRGFDEVISFKDISLINWSRANIIRTSHYPYSEEFLIQCDNWGIGVILEVPACSLEGFSEELFNEHKKVLLEIIAQYKHHPSILMWSLANEPATYDNASISYFNRLYESARAADPTRPIAYVTSQSVEKEKAIGAMDVILINRYSGWYQSAGNLDLIEYQIKNEITAWHNKYNKPVIITEYGAGSLPGLHSLNPSMWTEDYQVALLKKHFEVYDKLRSEGILSGEMIWNLIDFKTPQEYLRPGFCMKGVFTRQREPKTAAHVVRERYYRLF